MKKLKKRLLKKMKKLEVKNDEMVKVVEKIKKTEVKVLINNRWQIEDKLMLKERKCIFQRMRV